MNNQALTADFEVKTCPAIGFQKVSVCVPVTVKPFAKAGATETICCGDPIVKSGDIKCNGTKNGTCTFTVTQVICVKVPVEFGATTDTGDTFVDCKSASASDICHDCKKDDSGENED